jgi:hypothetical protein
MFVWKCMQSFLLLVVISPIVTSAGHDLRGKHPHHHCHSHVSSQTSHVGDVSTVTTATSTANNSPTHSAPNTIISTYTSVASDSSASSAASESPPLSIPHTGTLTTTSAVPSPSVTAVPDPRPPIAHSPLTPNGMKAGIAGGDAYPFMEDHIGWWYDWYVHRTSYDNQWLITRPQVT